MADITIPITISDAHATRALAAIEGLAAKKITIEVQSPDFVGNWRYKYEPKQSGETNKEFAERVIRGHIKAFIKLYEFTLDQNRYSAEIKALAQPIEDVPDDIIT